MADDFNFTGNVLNRTVVAYTTPDLQETRARVLKALVPCNDEKILELGPGPGFVTRQMALAVGTGGHITAVDVSAEMIEHAKIRVKDLPNITLLQGDAGTYQTEPESFDAVIAMQCLEFVTEIERALALIYRHLKPGGRVAIMDSDWGSVVWNASDDARMAQVLDAWADHVAQPLLPRKLPGLLGDVGFRVIQQEVLPTFNTRLHPGNQSYWMKAHIEEYAPGRRGLTNEDVTTWAMDLEDLERQDRYFYSLNRFLVIAIKPS